MPRTKKCIAMLLAGGQGSRLCALTEKLAKPAVFFGGKYRIIDFPLSNCVNSGIDTVGVMTQYQPLELNDYIGNGTPWDLDRTYGGVHMLPPYRGAEGGSWYKGTANAIYQNAQFIRRYNPEYILILSGDHIYKMDYRPMLDFHIETNAACTIAVRDVPLVEASRFGIMNTDETGAIYQFEEKPPQPKSTKASMGVYVFTTRTLMEYLEADEADENSDNDFGKNVIPAMLASGQRMMAYSFRGYWKDVGTIASLWEANMDLLGEKPAMNLHDESWRVFFRHIPTYPQYLSPDSTVQNALVAEGCEIEGTVVDSVLFPNVKVERGAVIRDSVLMSGTVVEADAKLQYCMADVGARVGAGAAVGRPRAMARGVTVLAAGARVAAGETVGDDTTVRAEGG